MQEVIRGHYAEGYTWLLCTSNCLFTVSERAAIEATSNMNHS